MFQRILVLTDLTDLTRAAFPALVAMSRDTADVRVVLAHAAIGATEQFFLDATIRAKIDQRAMERARPRLEALADELRALGVQTEAVLEPGAPFNVLFRIADAHDIDLIVLPTRHQHSVVRKVSSSVTARAIRAHSVPVMTINALAGEKSAGFKGFCRVLHPVDYGEGQRDGLRAAETFAREHAASLHLLHVIRPFHVDDLLVDADEEDKTAARAGVAAMLARAEVRLADELERVQGVEAESRVLVAETPGDGICAHASHISADCIVLPALGRDAVRTQLMGSVAEYVIAHAPCPVLFHDGRLRGR